MICIFIQQWQCGKLFNQHVDFLGCPLEVWSRKMSNLFLCMQHPENLLHDINQGVFGRSVLKSKKNTFMSRKIVNLFSPTIKILVIARTSITISPQPLTSEGESMRQSNVRKDNLCSHSLLLSLRCKPAPVPHGEKERRMRVSIELTGLQTWFETSKS